MENNQEPEIIVFTDEDGNDVNVQVLNYFFYNGDEYAVMTEVEEGEVADEEMAEIFFMKVVTLDEENVEYQPIEDDDLADKLFEVVNADFSEEDPE